MSYKIRNKLFLLGLFLAGGLNIYTQDYFTITGNVFNSRNEPIEGVSVSLEGQDTAPVVSETNGEFSLISETRECWLVFAPYEKYKTKKVLYSGSQKIKVYLS